MTALERSCRRLCLRVFSRIRGGHLELVEPEGNRLRFGDPDANLAATVEVHSTTFYRALLGGSVGIGEAYRDGIWDCADLVSLVRIAARNMGSLDRLRRRLHPMLSPVQRTLWRVPRNRKRASRRHISAHYDLGNDLFALYLDESMMYSSAVFPDPEASLAEGQLNRLERICQALELTPEDHLLEIGTGWGAMAAYAARNYGCRVTSTTISTEQREGALRRIQDAGVEDRVTVLLEDYRDLRGGFSKLVSLEMIEAVGWQYFDEFFSRCSGLLEPDGLFFLQAIVIDDRLYEQEKATRSFSNKLIFPGGCLPSDRGDPAQYRPRDRHVDGLAGRDRRTLRSHAPALARALHRERRPRSRTGIRRAIQAAVDALAGDERGRLPRAPPPRRADAVRETAAVD